VGNGEKGELATAGRRRAKLPRSWHRPRPADIQSSDGTTTGWGELEVET
jgi:hypothetical protein